MVGEGCRSGIARRALFVIAGMTAAVLAIAAPAAAHVTVNPSTAEPGGSVTLAFQVPNELDNADTTKVEVFLPAAHPIADVSVRPLPGWTVHVTTAKLTTPISGDDGQVTEAVSQITWSGGRIAPGRFEAFDVSMGPLPKGADTLYFKALQTYSSGEVVRWIDIPAVGDPEPEHPAPSIRLVAPRATPTGAGSADDDSGTTAALVAAIAGLATGLAGLSTGVLALRRRRAG
jgi:periplasmic copper chaperone A